MQVQLYKGIKMRTDTEMMEGIVQIAETLQVEAVALSGSRTSPHSSKDEFQDYDVLEDNWCNRYDTVLLVLQFSILG